MRSLQVLLLFILLGFSAAGLSGVPLHGPRPADQVSPDRLMEFVHELCRFEGRQSGTLGGEAAAAYIAHRLPRASFQAFPLKTIATRGSIHSIIRTDGYSRDLQTGKDFVPVLGHARSAHITSPVVFVGYGISDPAKGLDEYAGVPVAGKVVLFLRGQPKSYAGRVTHRDKVQTAKTKGAVAYLTVTGPVLAPYEQRRGMSRRPMALYDGSTTDTLPGLWIVPEVAEMLLSPAGISLESIQMEMDRSLTVRSRDTTHEITIEMEQRVSEATAENVMAFFPGSDPALSQETVVLGAHYDHFGSQAGLLFPGADDNASGTAVLLEIARVLASSVNRPKRSILLVAFAGEEPGLLGSRFYVGHPERPLAMTKAMINVDHAGVGNGKITVGLSKLEKTLAQAAGDKIGLGEKLELFGLFPGGDHVPFTEAGVPTATIVSSGPHPDFHQPTDTPDKINPEILTSIARYALSLLWTLANDEF